MDKGIKGLRAKGQGKPFSSLLKMQFKVEYSSVGMAEKIGLDKDKSRYTYLYFGLVADVYKRQSITQTALQS